MILRRAQRTTTRTGEVATGTLRRLFEVGRSRLARGEVKIPDPIRPGLEFEVMLRNLPTGTVTFVFTDIAGSTQLLGELGEERYGHELARHREALRTAFARHDGVEVDAQGDASFFAFPTASRALVATSDVTQALRRGPIRVRVGIHSGAPLLTDEGYIGMDVHRASRIADAGHGGQVLVSATTAALIDTGRFELIDLGLHRLKDLAGPERIYQLGRTAFPPLRSLSPSNLPVPPTPFLGRRRELHRVATLLREPRLRLLTLTGPGGTGKTRLAIQAAADSSDLFPDGLWWVPLSPLSDPRLVLSALATVTGVEERPDTPLSSELVTRFRNGRSLVVLDNAEHLLPSLTDELGPLISGADGARFLVTSRAPLHVEAEHEFPVPSMSPEDAELFILSRAGAIDVEFEPSPALTALCERLDHLPLALQLAVARLKVFSIEQLLERMTDVLDIAGHRDADPRQRTLRATIEWSHSLLTSEEMTTFRRLSVFVGGATMDAIEEVTDAQVESLSALLDQSLVHRRDDSSGPRFAMLGTIREFALERLSEAGEVEEIRERQARYYRSLAERARIAMDDARGDWLVILDAELENLRTTLSWYHDRDDHHSVQAIAGSLGMYWMDRGLLSEMRSWLERSLEGRSDPSAAHTLALTRLSQAAYLQGDYEHARTAAERSLAQARVIGDPADVVRAMEALAAPLEAEGSLSEAWALENEALEIARELHETRPRMLLTALGNLGYTCVSRGMYDEAVRYLDECVTLALNRGDAADLAATRCNLAMALLPLGRVDEAGRLGAEATMAAIDRSDQLLGADCLEVLAAVEAERGNHRFAGRLLGTAEALRTALGYELEPAERALHARTLLFLSSALTESKLTAALSEGAAMDLEEAFALIGREFLA